MITLIFHRINLTKLYISRMEKKNYLLYFTRIYVILSFMFLTSPTKYRYDSSRDSTRVAQQNCIKISWQSSYIYILLINNARLYRLLAFFCFFKPSFLKIGRQKIKKKKEEFLLSKLLSKRFVQRETPFTEFVPSVARGSDNLIPLSLKIHRERRAFLFHVDEHAGENGYSRGHQFEWATKDVKGSSDS